MVGDRRRAAGLSQDELGAKIGKSWQQVSKYERGKNSMTVETFADAARAVGAEPHALMREVEERL